MDEEMGGTYRPCIDGVQVTRKTRMTNRSKKGSCFTLSD